MHYARVQPCKNMEYSTFCLFLVFLDSPGVLCPAFCGSGAKKRKITINKDSVIAVVGITIGAGRTFTVA